jgi:hypothetical protein
VRVVDTRIPAPAARSQFEVPAICGDLVSGEAIPIPGEFWIGAGLRKPGVQPLPLQRRGGLQGSLGDIAWRLAHKG